MSSSTPSSLAISRSTDVPTGFQYAISVSGGGDGIIIWDVATGEIKKTLPLTSELGQNFHSADIECLKFCHGGAYLLSGSKDNSIKIWDVKKDYALLDTLNGHKAPVLALDFNESKQLIGSAGRDSTVIVVMYVH